MQPTRMESMFQNPFNTSVASTQKQEGTAPKRNRRSIGSAVDREKTKRRLTLRIHTPTAPFFPEMKEEGPKKGIDGQKYGS